MTELPAALDEPLCAGLDVPSFLRLVPGIRRAGASWPLGPPHRRRSEATEGPCFYSDRTPCSHRDHRYPCWVALTGAEQGQGEGAGDRLPQQSKAINTR